MATVTNLADRVCRLTGLQSTGTERALILEYLNDVYREAVERSECYPKTSAAISVAASAATVTLSSTITDLNKILSVYFTDYSGYQTLKLKPISMRRLRDEKDKLSSVSGVPQYYSLVRSGSTTTMHLYPSPQVAATMYVDYYGMPLTLVESAPAATEESTPTAIALQFHYRVLAAGAIALALETDQRKDSQPWWDRYEKGIADLTAWVNEMVGDGLIEPHFDQGSSMRGDRSRDLG